MGVIIGISGSVPSAPVFGALCDFARTFAFDNEWGLREEDRALPHAALRTEAGGSPQHFESVHRSGLVLVPHFLSDPLPLLVIGGRGPLTDVVAESAGHVTNLSTEILLDTSAAGPAAHREICRFVDELKARFVPDLAVDDESGWFASRNDEDLALAFRRSDRELRARYRASMTGPDATFAIPGARFRSRSGDSPGEFALVTEEMKAYVLDQDRQFAGSFGGFGYDFDHGEGSLEDLELVATEADRPGISVEEKEYFRGPFVHAAGAYLGRTLIRCFGGHWKEDAEEGWVIEDLAGLGLVVNPFLVVEDRVTWGPVQAFPRHVEWILRLRSALLAADDS